MDADPDHAECNTDVLGNESPEAAPGFMQYFPPAFSWLFPHHFWKAKPWQAPPALQAWVHPPSTTLLHLHHLRYNNSGIRVGWRHVAAQGLWRPVTDTAHDTDEGLQPHCCGCCLTPYTYRPIELASLIHAEVESWVHPTDAHQPHCQANKLQNPWNRKKVQVIQRIKLVPGSCDKPAFPNPCRASYRPCFPYL